METIKYIDKQRDNEIEIQFNRQIIEKQKNIEMTEEISEQTDK